MTKKGRCLEAQSAYVLSCLTGTVSGQARRGGGCADFASSSRPWIAAFLEFDDLAGRAAKTAILWQIVDISEGSC